MANISHFTQTVNGVSTTYDIHDANAIPRSGGAVMTGALSRSVNDDEFSLNGGTSSSNGASVNLRGKDKSTDAGTVSLVANDGINSAEMLLCANGNATWNGSKFNVSNQLQFELNNANLRIGSDASGDQHVRYFWSGEMSSTLYQFFPAENNAYNLGKSDNIWANVYIGNSPIVTSDIRQKTQIQGIDDALLDAWENVSPKTFKMVSAVEKKGETARFHTGYIAQDIQKACTDNNIDATRYGLFCFDSWDEQPEVTEDVEVEKDGIKTTETRIVQEKRAKGNSYSLRYEEALVVECKYLRRCIERLVARIEKLEGKNKEAEK